MFLKISFSSYQIDVKHRQMLGIKLTSSEKAFTLRSFIGSFRLFQFYSKINTFRLKLSSESILYQDFNTLSVFSLRFVDSLRWWIFHLRYFHLWWLWEKQLSFQTLSSLWSITLTSCFLPYEMKFPWLFLIKYNWWKAKFLFDFRVTCSLILQQSYIVASIKK